jgi:hypothetical protein
MKNLLKCLTLCLAALGLLWPNFIHSQRLTNWQLAIPKGIQINATTNAWHSGRVEDMVDFADGSVLVGTNSGGLWWADPTGRARVLSDTFNHPNISAVERGPYSQFHIFAAAATGALFENQSKELNAWQSVNLPTQQTIIRDIAILHGARRIIVASTTGVWWAEIPLPQAPRNYVWRSASGNENFWSVSAKSTGALWGAAQSVTGACNAEIAVVSRSPIHRDVFWVGSDGAIRTASNELGLTSSPLVGKRMWVNRSITAPGMARQGSRIAAIARGENHLDVFFEGPNGELRTTWWDLSDQNWLTHTYTIQEDALTPFGAITAIARTPQDIDLVYMASDNSIKHIAWPAPTGGWTRPNIVAEAGDAALASRIAVCARTSSILHAFWIRQNGDVRTNSFMQGYWRAEHKQTISNSASPTGGISAVSRDQNKLDIVWVSSTGQVMTTYWNQSAPAAWTGRAYPLTDPNTAFTGTIVTPGNITLLSRNPLQLDVFWHARDGSMRTNYWNQYSATNFTTQTYSLGNQNGMAIRNVYASSGFDDEISIYSVGSDGSLLAKQWTSNDGIVLAGRLGNNNNPVLKGTFSGGNLRLTNATLPAGAGGHQTTSVSISKYGTTAYAVVAGTVTIGTETLGDAVRYVYRTDIFSDTWSAVGMNTNEAPDPTRGTSLGGRAGGQGNDRNNTIAVSPVDNNIVYLGWVHLYKKRNTDDLWEVLNNQHLHDDVARIRFGDYDRSGRTVYFATDGGLSATFDLNGSFVSRFNEGLATLQCYTTDAFTRNFSGTLGASHQNNLIAAGLQDNGNVWGLPGSHWRQFDGGFDGGYFLFSRNGLAMRSLGTVFKLATWNGSALIDQGNINIRRLRPGSNPPTLLQGAMDVVNTPFSWDIFGAQIQGFGYSGVDIYSLWNATGFEGNRWEYETSLPETVGYISASGSASGQVSFFGTSQGRIFSYDRSRPIGQRLTETTVNLAGIPNSIEYGINRLTVLSDNLAYALLNRWGNGADNTGYVLRFDGTSWSPITSATQSPRATLNGGAFPVERHWSMEADRTVSPNILVLTTDDKVYISNDGRSWQTAITGLPRRAHLADIRFVQIPGTSTRRFYLSTYGRSVWFADVVR